MSLSGFIRGGFSVLMGLLSLYVLENTFGLAMDTAYLSFHDLVSKLYLGPGWSDVAIGTLGGWVWFDRAFVVCIIALFVWLVSLIFIDLDYGRQQKPGQY